MPQKIGSFCGDMQKPPISFFVHTPIFRRLQTSEGARHTDKMTEYQGRPGAALQIGATKEVRVSQRRALATAQNRPTVLLAAKTYGTGVLNPLFSSVFAHVRAENPIFSKTCRRCMA